MGEDWDRRYEAWREQVFEGDRADRLAKLVRELASRMGVQEAELYEMGIIREGDL